MNKLQFIFRLAWRDGRSQKKKMLSILMAAATGVAVLLALESFNQDVKRAVQTESKAILGADLVLSSRYPLAQEAEELAQKLGSSLSHERRLSTMLLSPHTADSALVQVRALEAPYPFFGQIELRDPSALKLFYQQANQVLLDSNVLRRLEIKIGDKIKLGEAEFTVAGELMALPGEASLFSQLAPRVVIRYQDLAQTKLQRYGSRIFYRLNILLKDSIVLEEQIPALEKLHDDFAVNYQTVKKRQENLDRTMNRLMQFLILSALIALVTGGIGIAAAVSHHLNSRHQQIATLRCLGASTRQATWVYIVQTLGLGFLAAILGILFGTGLQYLLPQVLSDFLAVKVESQWSFSSMLLGLFLGPVITLVFSLLPLWQLRKLSPMQAFREQDMEYSRSAKWLFYGIIASLILLYSALISNDLKTGLFFAAALLLAFLFLMLTAKLFMLLLKALPLNHLPFASRYAMKSLYRPKNQSFVLIVALGMASFMLLLIFFLKSSLLAQVTVSQKERQANMVFFDIQSDQVAALRQSLLEDQVEVIQEIPMISMRIASINGKGVKELRQNLREFEKAKNEKGRRSASWTLTREYRSTYRSELLPTEKILEGEFTSSYSGDGPIPISVEEGLMGRLGLKMNDLVVFDIQGIELECQISSKRKVDWMQMSPNFFVLFPANILEEAPQMNVFMLRGEGDLNAIQQKTVRQFSNVSTIDVSMILRSVGRILDSISFALQFIAFFSVVAAFVVQISSIQLSLQERIREAVLLKMIGSSKSMMIRVLNMEFLILSFLAFVLGATLALIATWSICQFVFKIAVQIHWPAIFICAGILLSFTFILATLNSQLVYRRTSMEGQRN